MVTSAAGNQAAPGELERVRALLNTWLIPNDSRLATDCFDDYARQQELRGGDAAAVRLLRDDLRQLVEQPSAAPGPIDRWVSELDVRPAIRSGRLTFVHQGRHAGEIFVIVLTAIAEDRLDRLKACPDCRWVFYDHTRNASKRWCLMNASGPQGRGCGTIAKVRRYRQRSQTPSSSPN
jgi:hypothetical protein